MSIFQDVELGWRGKSYKVHASRMMGAILVVEDIVTFPDLFKMMQSGKASLPRLAMAYAALLRYAGAEDIDDEKIYAGMFEPGHTTEDVLTALRVLMAIVTPPNLQGLGNGADLGNSPPARGGRSKSSKRSTRRR
jgi:hypothetical protein